MTDLFGRGRPARQVSAASVIEVPHSQEAEAAVIGGLMQAPERFAEVAQIVGPGDFYRRDHRAVFRCMAALAADGRSPDPLEVAERLERAGVLERFGGMPWIGALHQGVPTAANVDRYARIVAEKAERRRLVERLGDLQRQVVTDDLEAVRRNLTEVAAGPAAANEPDRFRFVAATALQATPIEWLVKGYLPRDSIGLLFGAPAAYKSFVAVDLGLSIATGLPWHGCRTVTGPVVFVVGEGRGGYARRFSAWGIRHREDVQQAPAYVSTAPAALTDAASVAAVRAALREVFEQSGPPALLVVDTLHRNYGPGDENSTADMGRFIEAIASLARPYGASIAREIARALDAIGARVRIVEPDGLRLSMPTGETLPPELLDQARQAKPELLALLVRRRDALNAASMGMEILPDQLWQALTAEERQQVDDGTLPAADLHLLARLLRQGKHRLAGHVPPEYHVTGPCAECQPQWIVAPASPALAGCTLCSRATRQEIVP